MVFPLPDCPTKAIVCPFFMVRLKFDKTVFLSYENDIFSNLIFESKDNLSLASGLSFK